MTASANPKAPKLTTHELKFLDPRVHSYQYLITVKAQFDFERAQPVLEQFLDLLQVLPPLKIGQNHDLKHLALDFHPKTRAQLTALAVTKMKEIFAQAFSRTDKAKVIDLNLLNYIVASGHHSLRWWLMQSTQKLPQTAVCAELPHEAFMNAETLQKHALMLSVGLRHHISLAYKSQVVALYPTVSSVLTYKSEHLKRLQTALNESGQFPYRIKVINHR